MSQCAVALDTGGCPKNAWKSVVRRAGRLCPQNRFGPVVALDSTWRVEVVVRSLPKLSVPKLNVIRVLGAPELFSASATSAKVSARLFLSLGAVISGKREKNLRESNK